MTVELQEHRHGGSAAVSPRELLERFDIPEGFRAHILGGNIVVSPRGSSKHGGIVRKVREQLARQLPGGLVTADDVSVESTKDDEDECVPDVYVVPHQVEQEDLAYIPADVVELVVEVVSCSNWDKDHVVMPGLYSSWNIPVYLLLDPRDGVVLLRSDPDCVKRTYRTVHQAEFGDTITLPEPLKDVRIDTSEFALYKPR